MGPTFNTYGRKPQQLDSNTSEKLDVCRVQLTKYPKAVGIELIYG
jgi:hypothetical protein